jgi:hypothetical protein
MILPVIIPLGENYKVCEIKQDIDFEIFVVKDICDSKFKRERIAYTKNRCKELGISLNSEYVVIQDSSLVHLYETNFSEMKKILDENKKIGAVSLLRKRHRFTNFWYEHICTGCVMYRLEVLKIVDFGNSKISPTCLTVAKSIVKNNWFYKYLDNKFRIVDGE